MSQSLQYASSRTYPSPRLALRPSGVTLVELLVVIGIIGLLLALALPALQSAREAARRASCANHLAQIGIALEAYHGTHQVLPPGWIAVDPASGRPYASGQPGWGWASMILPMIEQENVAEDLIDFSRPIASAANQRARAVVIATFRCPSATDPDIFDLPAAGNPSHVLARLATANYVGSFGSGGIERCGRLPVGAECRGNGVFYHLSRVRLDDVRDGLSQTVFVAEEVFVPERSPSSIQATWLGAVHGAEKAAERVTGTPDQFNSRHPGGVNCLMGDRAVRFVSGRVEAALVTRSRRDRAER